MTEEWFRIAVIVGVGLAALAFVVQAIVAIALYAAFRQLRGKVDVLSERVDPVIQKIGPFLDRAAPAVEKAGPMFERAGATLDRLSPLLEKSGPLMASVTQAANAAQNLLATVNGVVRENQPRIAEASREIAGVARAGREQAERLGAILIDASERARTRLEQIDETVNSTVAHVEAAGQSVKRAVLRPVREVNGVAAGISAAVATLIKGRKASVAAATQDEEMFI
jgi:hypothetical protein